jgi:hypothetical protein
MRINTQRHAVNVCPTGDCPDGVASVKEIGLSPREKRAIFFALKEEIWKQKKLLKGEGRPGADLSLS